MSYKLFVEDIYNPFMAHIHRAAVGVNGPIVVALPQYDAQAWPGGHRAG